MFPLAGSKSGRVRWTVVALVLSAFLMASGKGMECRAKCLSKVLSPNTSVANDCCSKSRSSRFVPVSRSLNASKPHHGVSTESAGLSTSSKCESTSPGCCPRQSRGLNEVPACPLCISSADIILASKTVELTPPASWGLDFVPFAEKAARLFVKPTAGLRHQVVASLHPPFRVLHCIWRN